MGTSAIVASSTHIFTALTRPNSTPKFSVHFHPTYSSLRFPLPKPFTISPLKSITTPNRTTTFKARSSSMAESKPFLMKKGNTNLTVFDSEEELSVSLAKYVADLSAKFVKKGALSLWFYLVGLSSSLSGNWWRSRMWDRLSGQGGMCFGLMRGLCQRTILIVITSLLSMASSPRLECCMLSLRPLKVPILPGNFYAINDALSAEGAADDYETCLKHLVSNKVLDTSVASGLPKFDLMLLGMGPDGHVASLFPGHHLLHESQKWVTFIKDSPKPPPERITFTFPVINSSAYIALVVCGAGKAGAVQKALGKDQNEELLPAGRVSAEEEFTWFLDKEAAPKL